jgi:hypothetical protein
MLTEVKEQANSQVQIIYFLSHFFEPAHDEFLSNLNNKYKIKENFMDFKNHNVCTVTV